jgi:hypothetical protein
MHCKLIAAIAMLLTGFISPPPIRAQPLSPQERQQILDDYKADAEAGLQQIFKIQKEHLPVDLYGKFDDVELVVDSSTDFVFGIGATPPGVDRRRIIFSVGAIRFVDMMCDAIMIDLHIDRQQTGERSFSTEYFLFVRQKHLRHRLFGGELDYIPSPIEAAGWLPEDYDQIPEDITQRRANIYVSVMNFMIAHEMAHLHFAHAASTPENEVAADRFACDQFLRMNGDPSAAFLPFYYWHIMLGGTELDPGIGTHPPTPERGIAVLTFYVDHLENYEKMLEENGLDADTVRQMATGMIGEFERLLHPETADELNQRAQSLDHTQLRRWRP